MKIKSTTEINALLEYSKLRGIRFPTELKRVQDNIIFSQIIIPAGRKNSGNVMTLEQTNKFIMKSTKNKGTKLTEEQYNKMLENLSSTISKEGFGTKRAIVRTLSNKNRTVTESMIKEKGLNIDLSTYSSRALNKLVKEAVDYYNLKGDTKNYTFFDILSDIMKAEEKRRSEEK